LDEVLAVRRSLAASDPAIMRKLLAAAGELRLVVVGSSMKPTILPGDSVVIRPLPGAPRMGDVLVYTRGGHLWCHRVLLSGRSAITKGDGRGRPDSPVPASAMIGRAVALQRGTRIIELHSLPARLAGLAVNRAAPAAALGRRLARGVGLAEGPGHPARHLLIAGLAVEVSGPRGVLEMITAKRGRPSIRPDFRISVEPRPGATTGGRYGLVESGRRGCYRLTTPTAVARFDLPAGSCRAEVVAGGELIGLAAVLRAAGVLLVPTGGGGVVLQASAVRHGGRAHLFAGPGGSGKSTALVRACEAGAVALADDLVFLRRNGHDGRWSAWGSPLEEGSPVEPMPDRRGTPVGALLVPARGKWLDLQPLSPAGWTALAANFPPAPAAPGAEELLGRLADLAANHPCYMVRFPNAPGALAELFSRLEVAAR
jgi:hypothetical protein